MSGPGVDGTAGEQGQQLGDGPGDCAHEWPDLVLFGEEALLSCENCGEQWPLPVAQAGQGAGATEVLWDAATSALASAEERIGALEDLVAQRLGVVPCDYCGCWADAKAQSTVNVAEGVYVCELCLPERLAGMAGQGYYLVGEDGTGEDGAGEDGAFGEHLDGEGPGGDGEVPGWDSWDSCAGHGALGTPGGGELAEVVDNVRAWAKSWHLAPGSDDEVLELEAAWRWARLVAAAPGLGGGVGHGAATYLRSLRLSLPDELAERLGSPRCLSVQDLTGHLVAKLGVDQPRTDLSVVFLLGLVANSWSWATRSTMVLTAPGEGPVAPDELTDVVCSACLLDVLGSHARVAAELYGLPVSTYKQGLMLSDLLKSVVSRAVALITAQADHMGTLDML